MANKDAMLEALEEIENGMCRIKERRSIWQNSLVYAVSYTHLTLPTILLV